MSGKQLAIFRLPIPQAAQIGHVRIVTDRHGQHYADGSKVVQTSVTGIHTALTLADGRAIFVLTKDLRKLG